MLRMAGYEQRGDAAAHFGSGQNITREGLVSSVGRDMRSYNEQQLFFLVRISYMAKQRSEFASTMDGSDWRMRLLNKAQYSTYRDCVELGVGDEAKRFIAQQTGPIS